MGIFEDVVMARDTVASLLRRPFGQLSLPTVPQAMDWLSQNLAAIGVGGVEGTILTFYLKMEKPDWFKIPDVLKPVLNVVPFDFVTTGPFRPAAGPAAGAGAALTIGSPIRLGAQPDGTLCVFVQVNGDVHLVSCSHVLNGMLNASVKSHNQEVATLSQIVPIQSASPAPNQVDCARAKLDAGVNPILDLPNGLGRLASASPVAAVKGNAVKRASRNGASGTIQDIAARVQMEAAGIEATFENQILIKGDQGPFAQAGDSGSLVVDVQSGGPKALGMAFAANDGNGLVTTESGAWAAVCPMQAVLDALGNATLII
jgi:hypothetical protein